METITVIKEVLVSAAAITASIVAIKGLYIWRRQLKGTTEYQVSERILKRAYKLQDSIRLARGAWMSVGELGQRGQEKMIDENETSREREARNEAYALWKRSKPVFEAVSELKIIKFKTRALWGNEAIQDIEALITKAFELRNAQIAYSQFRINPHLAEGEQKLMDKDRWIVYESGERDEFWKEVEGIVSKIENRFRPHLT